MNGMEEAPALRVTPAGEVTACELGYTNIRDAVGNLLDFRIVHPDVGYFLDDEGLMNGEPLNVVASMIAGQAFYGNVVMTAADPDDDGDTLPLADHEFKHFVLHMAQRWRAVVTSATRAGQVVEFRPNVATIPPPKIVEIPEGVDIWDFLQQQQQGDE